MKIIAIFHEEKTGGYGNYPPKIACNPPLTTEGYLRTHNLPDKLRPYGPFAALICSRMCRTSQMVSVLALEFNLDFYSMRGLGQHASKEGEEVFSFPGYENEGYPEWQKNGVAAFQEIAERYGPDDTVLIVSHRPVIAGIACHAHGISDPNMIRALALGKEFYKNGFVVFTVTEGKITLVTIPLSQGE